MDPHAPCTLIYPCPIKAAELFEPDPTLPPVNYLNDHTGVLYNDSDWWTASETDEEEAKEETASKRGSSTRNASTVVRRQPLGLLSVRMKEYEEKRKFGGSKSENNYTSKERQFASRGMLSVPFPRGLLTFVAEQSTPATKADIPSSSLKYNKVFDKSNLKPRAREPLGGVNTTLNARKEPKATSKPSRHRIQVALAHAKEEKENHGHVFSDSDKIDDVLRKRDPNKGQGQVKEKLLYTIETLPDPFILTSEDECDDPFEGSQSETRGAAAGEPDGGKGVIAANLNPALMITAGPAAVIRAGASKSSLRVANAPFKGPAVSFKNPLPQSHFHRYLDPDDIWSQCGLPMRKSSSFFPRV